MKKIIICGLLSLISFTAIASTSTTSFTNTSKYVIVVDCGSSGTRIHLFSQNSTSITEPVKATKVTPGVSSFIDDNNANPAGIDKTGLDQAMDNLVTAARQSWQKAGISIPVPNNTKMFIYATAGMRLVRVNAANLAMQEIATELTTQLNLETANVSAKVISGNEEALYDWLGINSANLIADTNTTGILDLGGASVEIAFQDTTKNPKDFIHFTFHDKPNYIATYSLLGEGADQAIASINGNFPTNRAICYPNGVWSNEALGQQKTINYNFNTCENNANAFLKNNMIAKKLELIHQLIDKQQVRVTWSAISGFKYTADFFNAQSPSELKNNASAFNGINWKDFIAKDKAKHQTPTPRHFLQSYDFNAAYNIALLDHLLNTNNPQVHFTDGVDWTNGVAFYYFFNLGKQSH